MAIVKANAYGHGLPEIARALRGRVAMLGVANLAEAQAVQAALGTEPGPGIFILGPGPAGGAARDRGRRVYSRPSPP